MNPIESKGALDIVEQRFGGCVARLLRLLELEPLPFALIRRSLTDLSASSIKSCLRICLQHQLIRWLPEDGGGMYDVDVATLETLVYYSSLVAMIGELFSHDSSPHQSLIEYALLNGRITEEQFLKDCGQQSTGAIRHAWNDLLKRNLLTIIVPLCDALDENRTAEEIDEPFVKRPKMEAVAPPSCFVPNLVELRRLLIRFRVVEIALSKFDHIIRDFLRALVFDLLTLQEIKRKCASPHVEEYLTLLTDAGFIKQISDQGGKRYSLDEMRAIHCLCVEEMHLIVRERMGDASARIWSFIQSQGITEQRRVEEAVLMSNREAKDCLYSLCHKGLVHTHQLSKSAEYLPVKTTFLYYIDKRVVCRMILMWLNKTLSNINQRRAQIKEEAAKLLSKEKRLNQLMAECGSDEERDRLREEIRPSEWLQLGTFKAALAQLDLSFSTTLRSHIFFLVAKSEQLFANQHL